MPLNKKVFMKKKKAVRPIWALDPWNKIESPIDCPNRILEALIVSCNGTLNC